uniref:Uncharacterized protein n=1 Tax=Panagrolaimus sp. ES5 TaxID=591445 RepID=A0AC34F4G6_9BILA
MEDDETFYSKKVAPPFPQEFSLPNPIIKYITENPTMPIAYYKLINCCKFFYYKNHIIVAHFVQNHDYNWEVWALGAGWSGFDAPRIDLENFPCKLWIQNRVRCYEETEVKEIIPKIYRCDAYSLHLEEQEISFKDFLFLSMSVKNLEFRYVQIRYADGTPVMLETILENLKNLKTFK